MSDTHLERGMRLFQAWFVSGQSAFEGDLHDVFKAWSDLADRDLIRSLYCLAHGQEPPK